jgi:hypothetical protein
VDPVSKLGEFSGVKAALKQFVILPPFASVFPTFLRKGNVRNESPVSMTTSFLHGSPYLTVTKTAVSVVMKQNSRSRIASSGWIASTLCSGLQYRLYVTS